MAESCVFASISLPILRSVEPIGRWFQVYRRKSAADTRYDKVGNLEATTGPLDQKLKYENELDKEEDTYIYLAGLDPKEWKSQDHYAVLGLKSVRYRASEELIKRRYKEMILKYHPDKSQDSIENVDKEEDMKAIFTCITKAFEILGDLVKKRAYDSVDPTFDDTCLPVMSGSSIENFYETFSPAFESYGRFSIEQPVPSLGDESSTLEEVENFYNFWYNFQSWREYSYLDEEDRDKGENREERRWIEKQNRAIRQKRKKEENARIRQLVNNAYSCDVRIKKFKDEEKERKIAVKRAKEEAVKAAREENERLQFVELEAQRVAEETLQQQEKEKLQKIRQERDELKKALRRERKILRTTCKKWNYFASTEEDRIKGMEMSEFLCEKLLLDELKSFNERLTKAADENRKLLFEEQVDKIKRKFKELELERLTENSKDQESDIYGGCSSRQWCDEEEQLLVKAVKVFPPGTVNRWECVTEFMKIHGSGPKARTRKEIIAKVKIMQQEEFFTRKTKVNDDAFSKFSKSHSKDTKTVISAPGSDCDKDTQSDSSRPWTTAEQKLLEKALKSYPKSTSDRWDRIAAAVPGRTKKECMKRYKELAIIVQTKKAAISAVQT